MLKYPRHKKICNCLIFSDNEILKHDLNHSFCAKCGSIILKDTYGNINYTIKPKQKKFSIEINPIDMIRTMKKNMDINYPNLINEFNMSKDEQMDISKSNMSKDLYLRYRKMILNLLQKLTKIFDANEIIFYQCLFYMDYIFSHKMKPEISENEIIYYLIGYFLCSFKMRETDKEEPSFNSFMKIKENILLSKRKIAYYEILCLKSINYNLYSYSAYDWIVELISIGIVFNCEIDNKNYIIKIKGHRHSIINIINKYVLKILLILTLKNDFIKYSPIYIAFSIIQISRERFLDRNLINHDLFNKLINLYGINADDYKKCYEELKVIISNNCIQKEKNEEEKINLNYNNNEIIKNENEKYLIEENNYFSPQQKLNKEIPLNNCKGQKYILSQKQKESQNENELKDKKNELNENNIKLIEKGNIEGEKSSENKHHFTEMKKNKSRKINHITINSKNKKFKSQDSMPVLNYKHILNIESMKERNDKKLVKLYKPKENICNNLSGKVSKYKENIPLSNISHLSYSNLKINKINKTLYKLASTKKNLFNISTSKTKYFMQNFGKSNNSSLFDDSKINNNDEFSKKNKNKKPIILRENLRYNLGAYIKASSLTNKKVKNKMLFN